MPTRIYSEESIKKRKMLSGDEKPTRKYTKTIKQEIKKEPMEMSDGDIDDDDVMDIEEADGTLPKKGKINIKQKRVMKTKKVKRVPKVEKEKDGKDVTKVKPKRKKKVLPAVPPTPPAPIDPPPTPVKVTAPAEMSKPIKKTPKMKEKKVKPKLQKPTKKPEKPEGSKPTNGSDSDSSPEESDAYETCGVGTKCQRPSGKFQDFIFQPSMTTGYKYSSTESVQDWILCDGGCEVWYHMVCVALKIKEVKPDMEFICKNCRSKNE